MDRQLSIEEIWDGTKHILLPYEGATSQLHMLDIPRECLLEIANRYLFHVSCNSVGVTTLEYGKSWDGFTPEAQELLSKKEDVFKNWIFEGFLDSDRSVRLFADVGNGEQFTLELVFWADEFFKCPDDRSKCLKSFNDLISIALDLRKIAPKSEFVFDAYEVGNPRERKLDMSTYFW